jgi:autotransporter strand-loop-strand O-heptosyltransferase
MPHSYDFFKQQVKDWIIQHVPKHKRILDVGPGIGTYSKLIRDHGYRIDAVEIFAPYIEKYDLISQYDNVFVGDICKFDFKDYDFIILGDVLEHLHVEDAVDLYNRMIEQDKEVLVAVPWEMEQGEHEGNIYETHHQTDLTPPVLRSRYPKLKLLFKNEYYGYYYKLNRKWEKAYVLYANSAYYDTVCAAVKSIKAFSNIPIIVYLLNDERTVPGAIVENWKHEELSVEQSEYIDRNNSDIYKLLIQRPSIVKHALNKYAKTIAYIDSDSVVTSYIDNIFNYMPEDSSYPYFTKGIYDYLFINGRGGVETREELHKSLEHPACELFGVDQSVRSKYHQTGFFTAGQSCFDFLDEWEWMCNHPKVLSNPQYYAPYHEETIANVLLWKNDVHEGLPYMYINYTGHIDVDDLPFTGEDNYLSEWVRLPKVKEELLVLHGEKRPEYMLEVLNSRKKKILFLAPHLSTGGMPAFLLKRIVALKETYEIYVVEFQNYSNEYVVQKNKIKELADHFYTLEEDKHELMRIIRGNRIDLVHIDEMSEHMGDDTVIKDLYCNCRSWRIIETCHNISFKPEEKVYNPDAYAFCTPYHMSTFKDTPTPIKKVLEFPIDELSANKLSAMTQLGLDPIKKHVVNIGLWTRGKNQGEGVELARQLPGVHFHFVGNQAVNFKDYWEPIMEDIPNNVFVHGERNDTHLWLEAADVFMFNSTWECNPLVLREAISYGLPILARNLPQYEDMFTSYITDLDPIKMKDQLKTLLKDACNYIVPTDNTLQDFASNHVELYTETLSTPKFKNSSPSDFTIYRDFALGPYIDIRGNSKSEFKVEIYDEEKLVYNSVLGVNNWCKLDKSYYVNWRTSIYKDDLLILDDKLNLEGRRVYIAFESSSLGDTIAWIPYALEFQKKHNCNVVVSTFKNFLFEDVYPELEFIKPGESPGDIYARYNIGWFYDSNKEPVLPNTIPLQQAASNILGLEYEEIVPRIKKDFGNPCGMKDNYQVPGKYVTIATNSTAGCKFWTREGWQEVIDFLYSQGYKVINTSIEDNPFNNCEKIVDTNIEYTIDCIRQSEFFIGLSSGLSWLAWALGKPVVMISNFTEANHEFSCIRVTNTNVCHGCWNDPQYTFDKGDWNWCPVHKGTDRQFECHKSITPKDVINVLPV